MKKHLVLLVVAATLLGATYKSKEITQSWKFDNQEMMEVMDALSGQWEIQTPEKLNLPVLTQTVKYVDYPKLLLRESQYYDFDATARIFISSENEEVQAGGMILRYRNLYSFYMLFVNAKDKRITLTRAALGGIRPIKRVNHEFVPDRWYELRASCYLNQIKAYVDGQLVLEAEDKETTGGRVGLVTAGPSLVYFSGLEVRAQTVEVVR